MGLIDRLHDLDKRAWRTHLGGGLVRARAENESVEEHLRYVVHSGAFGLGRVADDVLIVLDRLAALEERVSALEAGGNSTSRP